MLEKMNPLKQKKGDCDKLGVEETKDYILTK